MLKRYGDIYSGAFLLLLAIGMYIASFNIKMLMVSVVGSAFVPKITAAGMFIVSIFIIVKGIKDLRLSNQTTESDSEEIEDQEAKPNYFSVLLTLALIIGYIALMPIAGFLIMTTVYLFLQMYVLADRSKWKAPMFLVISIVTSGVIYYLFRDVFHVMLPSGILG